MKLHLVLAALTATVLISGCASRPLLPWRATAETPPPSYVGAGLPSQSAQPSSVALRDDDQDYDLVSLQRARGMSRSRPAATSSASCTDSC